MKHLANFIKGFCLCGFVISCLIGIAFLFLGLFLMFISLHAAERWFISIIFIVCVIGGLSAMFIKPKP